MKCIRDGVYFTIKFCLTKEQKYAILKKQSINLIFNIKYMSRETESLQGALWDNFSKIEWATFEKLKDKYAETDAKKDYDVGDMGLKEELESALKEGGFEVENFEVKTITLKNGQVFREVRGKVKDPKNMTEIELDGNSLSALGLFNED